jgi:hypothetical protein
MTNERIFEYDGSCIHSPFILRKIERTKEMLHPIVDMLIRLGEGALAHSLAQRFARGNQYS